MIAWRILTADDLRVWIVKARLIREADAELGVGAEGTAAVSAKQCADNAYEIR